MTGEKIEKALDCCINGKCGFSCPYCDRNFAGVFHCDEMKKDALAYINRLKSEKEQACKETAKEILRLLYEMDKTDEYGRKYKFPHLVLAEKIKEKFGVEVKE